MANTFQYTHRTSEPGDRFWERLFALIPGMISWGILSGMVFLAYFRPLYGAVAVIAYHIYWLFRLLYMTLFLVIAYGVLAVEQDTDWIARCRILAQGERGLRNLKRKLRAVRKPMGIKHWLDFRNQKRQLQHILKNKIQVPAFDSLCHLVIIAAAGKDRSVLEPGLKALKESRFPPSRIAVFLAVEERLGEAYVAGLEDLAREYAGDFMKCSVSRHPADLPLETKVKGANTTYAAKQAAAYFTAESIDFSRVIVSCFDADTVPGRHYFAALTYHFMRHPKRERASYQPIPVYDNNIWEASGFARVLEMGSSFFQLIEATNPEKLVTFSSHSMSFKALVEVGYWPVDMISDDSAIFWKSLIHYDGDYRVVPMYVTLSMDAVVAGTLPATLRNIYRQKLRWAWGVENFPIVMRAFIQAGAMSWLRRIRYAFKLLEMQVSWATLGFLVTLIGWLPAIFASREFSNTVLYYNSARITNLIFNLASAAFLVMIILSNFLLPKMKTRFPLLKRIGLMLEWLLVPLVFTFLSTLPALDAQTRLMTGRSMHFRVTEKKRQIPEKKKRPKTAGE